MTDTELLDWVEEAKPDIWFRTGFGVWAVSDEMTDPDFERYENQSLREAILMAIRAEQAE